VERSRYPVCLLGVHINRAIIIWEILDVGEKDEHTACKEVKKLSIEQT
jgi:hypothetical protein